MAARRPSRYLAPIALLAVGGAIYLVVKDHVHTTAHSATSSQITSALVQGTRRQERPIHHHVRRTYTVRSGDTLSGIAASTGVHVALILRLNPGLNPNALQTGQVIKLRR